MGQVKATKKAVKRTDETVTKAVKKAVKKTDKALAKEYAQALFMGFDLTRKEIATRADVTEVTLRDWIEEGKWVKKRRSLLTSKKEQLFRLYEILDALTTKIEETKFGDTKLADMMIKYTAAIGNLETETNVAQMFETMMAFNSWLLLNDAEMAKKIIELADAFLQEKIRIA